MAKKSKPNEIFIERIYDAPVELVWEVWTDSDHVANWWGPRGFSLTTHSKDLRVGGHWAYTMHGPDGTNYENKTIYHEIEKYSKLVYDHGGNDDRPPLFKVTVKFERLAKEKTQMQMWMALETAEAAEQTKKFIKSAGGNSTWDRLAEYLAEKNGKDHFFINRTFQVSIDLMFRMFTEAEHFSQWLPPEGATMKFLKSEIAVGKTLLYSMQHPVGSEVFGKVEYLEINKPHRLVYIQSFCDSKGDLAKPVFAPNWPDTMLTTVTLTEEDENQTRVTIKWEVYGKATAEEQKTFHDAKSGMFIGWTGSFDKLEKQLRLPI